MLIIRSTTQQRIAFLSIPVTTTTTNYSLCLRHVKLSTGSTATGLSEVKSHLWFPTWVFLKRWLDDSRSKPTRNSRANWRFERLFVGRRSFVSSAWKTKQTSTGQKRIIDHVQEKTSSYCSRLIGQLGISGVPWLNKGGSRGHKVGQKTTEEDSRRDKIRLISIFWEKNLKSEIFFISEF